MCFATSQAAKIIITLLESYVNRKLSLFIKLSIILCSNFIIAIYYERYLTVAQDSNSEPPSIGTMKSCLILSLHILN
jgi:hypothetical protein